MADYEAALSPAYLQEGLSSEHSAYCKGMSDYRDALAGSYGSGNSPDEAAYYQGMAHYQEAVANSSEEVAYREGVADAQASFG
jgi:hypothetical protein